MLELNATTWKDNESPALVDGMTDPILSAVLSLRGMAPASTIICCSHIEVYNWI